MRPSSNRPAHYHSYLVRLWQASGGAGWWASAQCASTGRVFNFESAEALFDFLRAEMAGQDLCEPDAGAANATPDNPAES